MSDFDLIIVGAGPAGSNAASVALDAGLRVVQIDGARFPRVKPCAGGVTMKAAGSLRYSLDPSVCRSFNTIEFNLWNRRRNRFTHPGTILYTVCRPEFDNRLVNANLSRPNFTFLDGRRVTAVEHGDRRFVVRTDAGPLTGTQLIGADGAYSIVNRTFRIGTPRALATAVEINIPHTGMSLHESVPCLDYGAISQGYGWVFPKDDHWSVGLYTLSPRTSDIRQRLSAYIASKGLPVHHLGRMEAFRIPVGGFRLRTPSCPVYVVGDAGGFADALTGEGIYYALESGRLAGEVAVDVAKGRGTHRTYYRRLWGSVLCDTAISYYLARPFYRNVDRGMAILENSLVWRPLIEGTARGATLGESVLKSAAYFVRSWTRELPRPQSGATSISHAG